MEDDTLTLSGSAWTQGPPLTRWGSFELKERVGAGGFGEVYRAFDPALQREIAVKLLRPDRHSGPSGGGESQNEAILREARAMARVAHENLVPIYGVDTRDGRAGFWTAFVRGKTLSDLVKLNGPFGPRETVNIGIDLCRAVSAVHAAGLLHRDIKTGNAMREEGGRILLMDFGLTERADSQTFLGGTPGYMAPELLRGAPASVRSDIYALGVLLYHLLTGKYPDRDGSGWTLLAARPDLPPAMVRTIHKAMDPDPAGRFASVAELASELPSASASASDAPISTAPRRGNRRFFIAATAVALAAAGGFAAYSRFHSSVPVAIARRYDKAHDLVQHYYRPKALETAIPELVALTKLEPGFAPAWSDLGRANFLQFWQLHQDSYADPARTASLEAIARDPGLAAPHVTLGMLYTETGKNDLATQELNTAFRIDRLDSDAWAARAELYYRLGRNEDCEAGIRKAMALDPADWRWPKQLAIYYGRTGNLDKAIEADRDAVRLSPDNARAYNNLGLHLMAAGNFPEARASLLQAIQIEPAFNRYLNLGKVERNLGHRDEAIKDFQEATRMDPGNYLAWQELGSYDKAVPLAEKQRKNQPKDAALLSNLGNMYARLGDVEHAVPLLRQVAALVPENADLLYQAGVAFELLGRRAEALDLIASALRLGYPATAAQRDGEIANLLRDRNFLAKTRNPR